ncbi:alpha-tectorin-like [Bufo bufo]|uniref:alpha-tectorin-like n=1 Tax=Bufo bufo TaxID=8384 RepID=UPI001ABE5C61|nr:alpha-tectorin-like [Bufo bufo]
MKMNPAVIFLLLVIVDYSASANTGVLYPYGAPLDKETMKADDGASSAIKATVPVFGKQYSSIYVNNNGLLSFDVLLNNTFIQRFPFADGTLLAPFWADVDNEISGNIYYRMSQDSSLITQNAIDLASYFPGISYTPKWVLVATWDKVAFYKSATKRVNTFQAVLSSDETMTFVMYNYAEIEWTTGTNQGGNSEGLSDGDGSIPALAGGNNGATVSYFEIPGSLTSAIINITTTSNVEVRGRWVFRVDQSKVISPNVTSNCPRQGQSLIGKYEDVPQN